MKLKLLLLLVLIGCALNSVGNEPGNPPDSTGADSTNKIDGDKAIVNGYIVAIIVALPGILGPLLAWFLKQRGASRRAMEFESLRTRMELVERLQQTRQQAPDSKDRFVGVLDAEISDILDDLEALREITVTRVAEKRHLMGGFKRFFLLYKQASFWGRVYKGLFYAFSLFGLFMVLMAYFISTELMTESVDSAWITGLIGLAFYLAIGLAFRSAAVRSYKRFMKKAEAAESGN